VVANTRQLLLYQRNLVLNLWPNKSIKVKRPELYQKNTRCFLLKNLTKNLEMNKIKLKVFRFIKKTQFKMEEKL